MLHIPNIYDALEQLIEQPVTPYKELPLSAQLRILMSRAFAAHSQIAWWTPHIDDTDKTPEFRKRAIAEVNAYQRSLDSILPVIKAAAHYRDDGATDEVCFDTGYIDENGNPSGDYEHHDTAVTGHPYAWVQQALATRLNINFDNVIANMDSQLILSDLHKVYDKAAGTYLAQLILIECALYTPGNSERAVTHQTDTILLAANSPALKRLAKLTGRMRDQTLLRMLKPFENFPFHTVTFVDDETITTAYDTKTLYALWNELEVLDSDERDLLEQTALDHAAKNETKSLVHTINETVRETLHATTVMTAISNAVTTMKKAGMSDEHINALTEQLTKQLTPQ